MPSAFLISPAGEVLHTAPGSRTGDWEALVRRIEEELRRPGVRSALGARASCPHCGRLGSHDV